MTYDQYWYDDPFMVKYYREADRMRHEQANLMAWLQGRYIYDAISINIGNAFRRKGEQPKKYLEKPYEVFKREKTEEEKRIEAEQERQKAIAFFNSFAKNKKKLGKH